MSLNPQENNNENKPVGQVHSQLPSTRPQVDTLQSKPSLSQETAVYEDETLDTEDEEISDEELLYNEEIGQILWDLEQQKKQIQQEALSRISILQVEVDKAKGITSTVLLILVSIIQDSIDPIETFIEAFLQAFIGIGQVASILLWFMVKIIGLTLDGMIYLIMKHKNWVGSKSEVAGLKNNYKNTFWFYTLIDKIPIIGVLPLETIGTLYIWSKIKKNARDAEAEIISIKQQTDRAIRNINHQIQELS